MPTVEIDWPGIRGLHPSRRPRAESLVEEEWPVPPPEPTMTELDIHISCRRCVTCVRYSWPKTMAEPTFYVVTIFAGDLDQAEHSLAAFDSEADARDAFTRVLAEMRRPVPRFYQDDECGAS